MRTRPEPDPVEHLQRRLREGLEEDITLVIAKSVLGLLEAGVEPSAIVRTGVEFGTRYRDAGWGAGLTTLIAMANLIPHLASEDRALALVHGLAFVARDTRGRAPNFPVGPLTSDGVPVDRLERWYRRFVDTRASDAAERVSGNDTRRTRPARGGRSDDVRGRDRPRIRRRGPHHRLHEQGLRGAGASRRQRGAAGAADARAPNHRRATFRGILGVAAPSRPGRARGGDDRRASRPPLPAARSPTGRSRRSAGSSSKTTRMSSSTHCSPELHAGADAEQLARAIVYAAALRLTRFHVQNEHGDWNTVHHSFTSANALHHALQRNPTPELVRGCVHAALRVYLDRFLNVPAARLPRGGEGRPRRARAMLRSAGRGR